MAPAIARWLRARLPAGVAICVLACAGVSLAQCLPGLQTASPLPDSGQPPTGGPFCGDGVINYDGGDGGEQCDPGETGTLGCTKAPTGCKIDCTNGFVDRTT